MSSNMTPNINVTPFMIQINGRIIGNFCPILQLKAENIFSFLLLVYLILINVAV